MTAHNEWAKRPADQRFKTLAELAASVNARRDHSTQETVDVKDMRFSANDEGNVILTLGEHTSHGLPTNWSFGQICSALKAPTKWLQKTPAELAVKNLEWALSEAEQEQFKVMKVLDDENPAHTIQAVTSPTYGRIWDADVVASVQKFVERSGGRFHNPLAYANNEGAGMLGGETEPSGLYASDRDCFMFLINGGSKLEIGERAELNHGLIVWNSEVGSRSFGMMRFAFNEVCGNHIIWGAKDINKLVIYHKNGAPVRFAEEAIPAMMEAANKPLDTSAIEKAQKVTLDQLLSVPAEKCLSEPWIKTFADKHGFTRSEVREAINAANAEETKCVTVWDLVQGLTAHARKYANTDTRLDLELRAGKLLDLLVD